MLEKRELNKLLARYLTGDHTQQDVDQLLLYFSRSDTEEELRVLIEKSFQDEIDLTDLDHRIKEIDKASFAVLQHHISSRKIHYWSFIRVAASILLVLGLGWTIYQYVYTPFKDTSSIVASASPDIAAGTDRAMLTLSNGRVIVLDGKGIINRDGIVSYRDGKTLAHIEKPQLLTLRTPLAGQYKATLPDGTRVWLNAGSEISYPSAFNTTVRQVSMKGEVYFEVAKDPSRPLIIESEGQRVEVLGTHFNINAYKDNGDISTTLSEGSVRVIQSTTGKEVILRPGQQSITGDAGTIQVKKIDIDQVLSWKDGMYILKDQELGLFAKQITRWYNVDVDMGTFASRRLSAIIPRSSSLSTLLEAITLETGIHFKVKERRVTAIQN